MYNERETIGQIKRINYRPWITALNNQNMKEENIAI